MKQGGRGPTLIRRTKKSSLPPNLLIQQLLIYATECSLNIFGLFFTTNVFKIPSRALELCENTSYPSFAVGWVRHHSGCLTWRSFGGWQNSDTGFVRIKPAKACTPYWTVFCSFLHYLLCSTSICVCRLGQASIAGGLLTFSTNSPPDCKIKSNSNREGKYTRSTFIIT